MAVTGKQIWKSYTISEEARPTKKNKVGTQLWGPSGAGIWSTPTVDVKRRLLYVTTGDNYSDPPTAGSEPEVEYWPPTDFRFPDFTSKCRRHSLHGARITSVLPVSKIVRRVNGEPNAAILTGLRWNLR